MENKIEVVRVLGTGNNGKLLFNRPIVSAFDDENVLKMVLYGPNACVPPEFIY